ncbi:FAD-dependent monooxygenase [Nocardiopsis exhalans]|uniref:FAD-dependent monooxygenase n=1 Tax=Nocardiopsis exhalans TaxID=163604 RepID=A0ABY5DDG5_9ACTN|nr:FAD-dependent monooxygenase [Nocardiopsis exhalans]USY22366.1 FAD-dependent monooxygenase [Nocardiopsis exhalans]
MTKALIIGGGIGGPVAAAALQRAGTEAIVYEAHSGPGGGIGAFLTLAPNGLAALRTLGMLDAVRAAASFPTTGIEFVNGKGRRLGLLPDGSDQGPPELRTVTINRDALQSTLAETAQEQGVRIEYGKRFVGYTETDTGVVAEFADGTTAEADVLIGADGIHSQVRRLTAPDAPRPDYTGLLNIGGYVRAEDATVAPTRGSTARMVFGKRAFFGYQTAPSGEVYWFANFAHTELPREQITALGDDAWKEYVLELFADDHPDVTALLKATAPARFRPLGVYDLASLPNWSRGRLALLGDAAHAVSSSSGQGASLSVEDALVLAACLRDLPTPEEAFTAYEQRRRDRVERIAAEGRRRGDQKAAPASPAALFLRDLMLRVVFRMVARFGSHSWINDYRVDFDEPVTAPHQSVAYPR